MTQVCIGVPHQLGHQLAAFVKAPSKPRSNALPLRTKEETATKTVITKEKMAKETKETKKVAANKPRTEDAATKDKKAVAEEGETEEKSA
jgi:hypothetical protein